MLPTFLKRPLCFEKPERISDVPSWHGHIPFAFTIVDLLRPKLLVELGAYKGDSYCAFCQAVDRLGLGTRCYAVDTWKGDEHTGSYSEGVFEELSEYNDSKYGRFSTLVRSTFDDALPRFRDGSIDLLHIDGCHSYDAVKHDFESWLPKMSSRGVILFHDTNCHLKGFGVWRLWSEVRGRYPSFEFKHGDGLGVLAVGRDIPEGLREFLGLCEEEPQVVSEFFSRLGEFIGKPQAQDAPLRVRSLEAQLENMNRSVSWRLATKGRQLFDAVVPIYSKRRRAYHLGKRCASILLRQGPVVLSMRALEKAKPARAPKQQGLLKENPCLEDERDYSSLLGQIRRQEDARLAGLQVSPPALFSQAGTDLRALADSLEFPGSKRPNASIIIPAGKNASDALERLASVLDCTAGCEYEVIVIGNAQAGPAARILRRAKNISYVGLGGRPGFFQVCGMAAKQARGEFLVFLGDGARASAGWLRPLISAFSENPGAGAAAPKMLLASGRLKSAGGMIAADGSIRGIGLSDDPGLPQYNYPHDVDCCSPACFAVRRETFLRPGGFKPDYSDPDYGAADLCMRLRKSGRKIIYSPQSVVISSAGEAGTDSGERRKFMKAWRRQVDGLNRIRLIALYLPQFYPIPENDAWWGKGFTEWTNVAKARPNFEGHYQPHLPADLGFYDLRVEKVMEEQAKLAKHYGIYGFCFHYYWLNGKRMLEMPLERMLKTGKPDIPFCLCWANHNWSRTWDGTEDEMLMEQKHSYENDCAAIRDIIRYMRHPNYIRVGGKPILLVFNVVLLPEPGRTTRAWRRICREEGVGEIFLVMCETYNKTRDLVVNPADPREFGFDAAAEFPPHSDCFPQTEGVQMLNPKFRGPMRDYRRGVLNYFGKAAYAFPRLRMVMPSWDNTARRQDNGLIFVNSSPGNYRAWLEGVLDLTRKQNSPDERIAFINAWNEWAEGTHLEPDRKHGRRFLEMTKKALESSKKNSPTS